MASLLAPVVPGATSLGNVLAQASQSAQAQSRTILAAASAIARSRERAGKDAVDAGIQRRMERFQREQFAQKSRVADQRLANEAVRLGFAGDANERANIRAPKENALLDASINDAPLRSALLGQSILKGSQEIAQNAHNLNALPQLLDDQASIRGDQVRTSAITADELVGDAERRLKEADKAEETVASLHQILALDDGSPESVAAMIQNLHAMKSNPDFLGNNQNVIETFNSIAQSLGPAASPLIIPDAQNDPLGPGESRTTRTDDGQVTRRGPSLSASGAGAGDGMSSQVRLQFQALQDQRDDKRASEARPIEDRITDLQKQRSDAKTSTQRIALSAKIKSQADELADIEQTYRADSNAITNRMEAAIKAAAQPSIIDPVLFGEGPVISSPDVNSFLKSVGVGGAAQKKTSSVNPDVGNPISAPQAPLPRQERQEGEFRVFAGPVTTSDANDADSFLIENPQGDDEHFRLYFADALETNSAFPSKVRTQANYFGINEQDVSKVGKTAEAQTAQWMNDEPFEVVTRNERIMNSKRDHAMIFFPSAPLGERWLAERLVRQGFGMITTKGTKLPDGTSAQEFRKRLRTAESVAKANKLGAWAFTQ